MSRALDFLRRIVTTPGRHTREVLLASTLPDVGHQLLLEEVAPTLTRRQFLKFLSAAPVLIPSGASLSAEVLDFLAPRPTVLLPYVGPSIAELAEITRAFIPRMVVQIYNSSPLFSALLRGSPGAPQRR